MVISIITYFYNYFIRILNLLLQGGRSLSPTHPAMLGGYIFPQRSLLFGRGNGWGNRYACRVVRIIHRRLSSVRPWARHLEYRDK